MSAAIVAPATEADFAGIARFVAESTAAAFNHPELTEDQRAENAWVAEIAPRACLSAIGAADRAAFVAKLEERLAGFVIVDRKDPALPEIDWLIVHPDFHGAGVAGALMQAAYAWIGPGLPIRLGVIHFNRRAIAFYEKHGFRDTGRASGTHRIRRMLMIRPAEDNF